MPHGKVGHYLVPVASALLFTEDVTVSDQLRKDSVGSSFGDAYALGDIAQPDSWIARNASEHVGVVGQEVPAVRGR